MRAHRWTDSSINSTNQRSALSAPLSAVPLAALHCLLTLAPHARPQSAAFGCFASCTTVCGATAAQTAASASVLRSSRLTHRTPPLRFSRVECTLAVDRGTSVVDRLWRYAAHALCKHTIWHSSRRWARLTSMRCSRTVSLRHLTSAGTTTSGWCFSHRVTSRQVRLEFSNARDCAAVEKELPIAFTAVLPLCALT